jgi:hypothetical protein
VARLLVLICGVLGGILVPRFFDAFIIGSSAFSGAVMSIIGAHHLFPNLGLFDIATGGPLPTALAVVLTLLGVIWQSKNIAKWAGVLPIADRGPLG